MFLPHSPYLLFLLHFLPLSFFSLFLTLHHFSPPLLTPTAEGSHEAPLTSAGGVRQAVKSWARQRQEAQIWRWRWSPRRWPCLATYWQLTPSLQVGPIREMVMCDCMFSIILCEVKETRRGRRNSSRGSKGLTLDIFNSNKAAYK